MAVSASLGLLASGKTDAAYQSLRQLTIPLAELCNRWGWRPSTVRQELKGLEWDCKRHAPLTSQQQEQPPSNAPYRTGIRINLSDWSWWLWLHGDQIPLSNERMDRCLDYLNRRIQSIELTALSSLDKLTHVLSTVAEKSIDQCYPITDDGKADVVERRTARSRQVHELIQKHFSEEPTNSGQALNEPDKEAAFTWPPPVTDNQVLVLTEYSKMVAYIRTWEQSLTPVY